MGELSNFEMFSNRAPASWRRLFESLAELEQLLLDETMGLDEKRAAAVPIRHTLHEEARRLADNAPPELDCLSAAHRRTFSEAVLLASYFPRSVGAIRLDTLDCQGLRHFPVDMQGSDEERRILGEALREAFGWTEAEIDALQARVGQLTAGLRLKHAVTAVLYEHLQADAARADFDGAILRFFQNVYGPIPFRAGDIGVTITEASVNFGIWFKGVAVTRDGYEARPADERRNVQAFLTSLRQGTWRTERFPGFGHFDESLLSRALVSQVTQSLQTVPGFAGTTHEVVFQTMCTMFTCFSAHEAEKYLIHDTWGHCWQQSICEFEWSYRDLAFVRDDLSPTTGVRFAGLPPERALASAFEVQGGTSQLNRVRAREILEAEIRSRITVCVNAVVAEMLADVVEHKFIRYAGRHSAVMKSSSVFREMPLKIDLTYEDIHFHLRFWRRPFRRLTRKAEYRERLADELHRAGLPKAGLKQAVRDLAEVIGEFDTVAFRRKFVLRSHDDGSIAVDIPRRLFLAAVTIDRALSQYLEQGDARYQAMQAADPQTPRWHCPLASVDLLLVTLAWMYEQDREMNFWHLDELIRDELTPTMLRFEQGLRKVLDR